jgi:GT2 family glycosyltransferase/glycosyltransferase involved in cell wall biosynthesis
MLPLDPETRSRLRYAGARLAEYEARREEAELLAAGGDGEGSLKIISEAAVQAYTFLGGHFSDPGLDDLLTRIGGQILADVDLEPPSVLSDPFRADLLHLVSYTGFVGGHTELLRQWLRTIRGMKLKQALFSTELIATVEFERWGELIELADKPYFSNSALTLTQRMLQLARFIRAVQPRILSLFIHPHDVVTLAVLGAIRKKDPKRYRTVLINHADHAFWLGSSMVDHVIEFRSVGEIYTRRYRGIKSTTVIPLTCPLPTNNQCRSEDRAQLRQELRIPGDASLSISIASLYKILGARWDYFDAIVGLLRSHPTHHHLLILGQGEDLFRKRAHDAGLADRFHVWGKRPNLVPYYRGADFLIETFPLMGGNVRQEAMVLGCPIIVVNPPGFEQNTRFLGLPEGYPVVSHQVELEALAGAFIRQPTDRDRLGQGLADFAAKNFSYEKVASQVRQFITDFLADQRPAKSPFVDSGYAFPFHRMYQQYALSKAEQEFLVGAADRGLRELTYAVGPDEPSPAMKAIVRRHLQGSTQPNYGDEEDRLLTPALVAWAKGNLEEASREAQTALSTRPGLSSAWRLLADAAIDLDRRDQGAEALVRAVSIDPTDDRSRLLLAQIYLGLGDLSQANALVQQLLHRNEHDVEALLFLSQLCYRANKPELAETFLRSAAQIEPCHPRLVGPGAWFSPGEKKSVSVVVTAMNNLPLTHRCLESIRFHAGRRVEEIIVVDDGSNDGTIEYLQARAQRWDLLKPVRLDSTQGFATAANEGARRAQHPYILLVDNDIEVRPHAIAALAEPLDRDDTVAMVQGKLLSPHGLVEHAGYGSVQASRPGAAVEIHSIRKGWNPADPTLNERLRLRAVSASMMMIRRNAFAEQEGFDPDFVNGMEDIDLSLRIGLTGKWCLYEPGAVGIHVGGASGWARWEYRAENLRRFWNRWRGEIEPDFIVAGDGSVQRAATSLIEPYPLPELIEQFAH